ncbi:hypothetical protein PFISCL1PPCAC_20507, partial [Pristionchus fissidentatus]
LFQTMDNGTVDYRSVDDSPQNEMEWRSANHNPVYNYNQVDHQPANYPISNHQKPFSQWTELTNCNAYTDSHLIEYGSDGIDSTGSNCSSCSSPRSCSCSNDYEYCGRETTPDDLDLIDVNDLYRGEENSQPPKLSPNPRSSKSLSNASKSLPHLSRAPKSSSSSSDPLRPFYWSYSSLAALALSRSPTGRLTVAQIYDFICEHFPYYQTARDTWKNSIRHNLSFPTFNPKFMRIMEEPYDKKKSEWMINPVMRKKLEKAIQSSMHKEAKETRRPIEEIVEKYEKISMAVGSKKGECETRNEMRRSEGLMKTVQCGRNGGMKKKETGELRPFSSNLHTNSPSIRMKGAIIMRPHNGSGSNGTTPPSNGTLRTPQCRIDRDAVLEPSSINLHEDNTQSSNATLYSSQHSIDRYSPVDPSGHSFYRDPSPTNDDVTGLPPISLPNKVSPPHSDFGYDDVNQTLTYHNGPPHPSYMYSQSFYDPYNQPSTSNQMVYSYSDYSDYVAPFENL